MEALTPILNQYKTIKAKYPDTLLLFRMGDFYEMLYSDAIKGAKLLGITLTQREYGKSGKIPLAGVPQKNIDSYLKKLLKEGVKVAICEQLEKPGQKKKLLERDVVEVITPGTITHPELLDELVSNYLFALVKENKKIGFSFADISTGEFQLGECSEDKIEEIIKKIAPVEVIYPESCEPAPFIEKSALTPIEDYYFNADFAYEKLTTHFKVQNLEGLGCETMREGIRAAGAILSYIEEKKKGNTATIHALKIYSTENYLFIDEFTRRNLELFERQRDRSSEGTLFYILNQTKLPSGARLLRNWMMNPLIEKAKIEERLNAVEEGLEKEELSDKIRKQLNNLGDPERIISKIANLKANPRDISSLLRILDAGQKVKNFLENYKASLFQKMKDLMGDFSSLREKIRNTIVDSPPASITEGGIIKEGVNPELDELRSIAMDSKKHIANLEEKERKRTGIPKLRIGYNSVFGYYIEVTKSYITRVPKDYIRKQTLVGAERFITPEIKKLEEKITHAEERINLMEYEIFLKLREKIKSYLESLYKFSKSLSTVDVLLSLAKVAKQRGYKKPTIEDSFDIEIKAGRHPVVESILKERFIPNDTHLDKDKHLILLITGPNMSGKSTYLRQVALIVLMAQMGSFVPAEEAKIGIVDKIFTRIGASDDLSRGVSTFLAEMAETANILHNSTPKSLVILDEIGRGTSTYDGMAIAWAVIEHLHNSSIKPRTLFATHYHELTELEQSYPGIENLSFAVKERNGDILFLRKLKKGPSNRSYGIEVARLAGLPKSVVDRAQTILERIHKNERLSIEEIIKEKVIQLSFFKLDKKDEIIKKLQSLKINKMSPLEALQFLAHLKKEVQDN